MKNLLRTSVLFCALASVSMPAGAQVTIAPLSSFGGGDGWFAPGENLYSFLGTANNERGLTYNPDSGHLLLVSRTGGVNVRILNATTGEDIGGLDVANIGGGTFPLSTIAVTPSGAIYAANVQTPLSETSPFRIYRWESEAGAPVPIFAGTGLAGARLGDSFNVFGDGADTRLVAGFAPAGTSAPPGTNGYLVVKPGTSPETSSATAVTFPSTPPGNGDFRLGIAMIDANTVIGAQGGTNPFRLTDFDPATGAGTLVASPAAFSILERPMDYAIVGGVPLLATLETGGATTATGNTVHIYDMSDPTVPVHLTSLRNTTSVNTNSNGVGAITWGAITGDTATLYAMNTNNGIQAFTVTVPEPGSIALLLGGLVGLGSMRPRRRQG